MGPGNDLLSIEGQDIKKTTKGKDILTFDVRVESIADHKRTGNIKVSSFVGQDKWMGF